MLLMIILKLWIVFFSGMYLFGEFVNILVMWNGCDRKCWILCVWVIDSLFFGDSLFMFRIVMMLCSFL